MIPSVRYLQPIIVNSSSQGIDVTTIIVALLTSLSGVAIAFFTAHFTHRFDRRKRASEDEWRVARERLTSLYQPAIQMFTKDFSMVTSPDRIFSEFKPLELHLIANIQYAEPTTQIFIAALHSAFITAEKNQAVIEGFSKLSSELRESPGELSAHHRHIEVQSLQMRMLHLQFSRAMKGLLDEYVALCRKCGLPDAEKLTKMYKDMNSHFLEKPIHKDNKSSRNSSSDDHKNDAKDDVSPCD